MKRSGISRLSGLAGAFLRTASSAWWGRITGRETEGWGSINPRAIDAAVEAFGELKGLPMKLGQILSYADNALPDKARAAFSVLQRQSQPMPWDAVASIIQNELPETADELIAALDKSPVSSASIGQVYRARLVSGESLAIKIQYPGIAEAIAAEMRVASSGAGIARAFAPGAGVDLLIAEIRERLLEECDYENEAANQEAFYRNFAGHKTIAVPAIDRRFSRKKILASQWIDGVTFETWLATNPSPDERNAMGSALYEFYISSLYRFGMFNADPHPGNYLISPGRIWFLDYGCVRKFNPQRVQTMRGLSLAVQADKQEEILAALYALGMHEPLKAPFPEVRQLLRGFFEPILEHGVRPVVAPSATGFSDMLKSKKLLLSLGLPPDILFLLRIKYGLYSILARLGARCDWQSLEAAAATAEP